MAISLSLFADIFLYDRICRNARKPIQLTDRHFF